MWRTARRSPIHLIELFANLPRRYEEDEAQTYLKRDMPGSNHFPSLPLQIVGEVIGSFAQIDVYRDFRVSGHFRDYLCPHLFDYLALTTKH